MIRVGMLGGGVVGDDVARLLLANHEDLQARVGAPIELAAVAVRDAKKKRANVPASILTTDAAALVRRDDIDIVIEVMGGVDPARELILAAMESGKSVITANKALLAAHGVELYQAAAKHGVDLYYEASVAGGIPIIRPLRESLAGDHVRRIMGIVNGTTNYILTKMDEQGSSFQDALAGAQKLGYAEADPTADVEGYDSAAKAAILASLAFHSQVTATDVYREGITALTADDIKSAQEINHVIKLLAIAELTADDQISVRVHPAMIPRTHPLAAVRDAFNAVFIEGEAAGQLMFYGRGAGGAPTASAILGDLVAVARHRVEGSLGVRETAYAGRAIASIGQTPTQYHVRLEVADRPGVLAAVAQAFSRHNVSILTVRQEGLGEDAELVVATHTATDADLAATVQDLRSMSEVRRVASTIRVEGGVA